MSPIKRQGKSRDGKAWAFTTFGDESEANIFEEISSETDRVAVIVVVAYLEELLREIVRAFLVNDEPTRERMLNPIEQGAISSFAALVDIAFLVGVISKDVSRVLKSMAVIRNHFAHDPKISTFEDLTTAAGKHKKTNDALKKFRNNTESFVNPSILSSIELTTKALFHIMFHMMDVELRVALQYSHANHRAELSHPHIQPNVQVVNIANQV